MDDTRSDGIRLLPAAELALPELADAFNAAFEGYFVPMHHSGESLAAMVRTNDIHLADSLIARTRSGDLLGVGLLGVRGTRGWIGGMAIVPPLRGHGRGALLLTALIDRARQLGLRTLQLEVLDQNAPARRLYARLGFVETRPLVVYAGICASPTQGVSNALASATALPIAEALAHFASLHAEAPPWQREEASLQHMAPTLTGLSLRDHLGLRAYLLWMPSGGGYSLLDFGTRASGAAERTADAAALTAALIASDHQPTIRAINVPPGDALGDALNALGCPVIATQREMHLSLT